MHISIEKGKTIIIRLMAVGPVVEGVAQRDVWFEVNGEVSRGLVSDPTSDIVIRCGLYLWRTRTQPLRLSRGRRQHLILDQLGQ